MGFDQIYFKELPKVIFSSTFKLHGLVTKRDNFILIYTIYKSWNMAQTF